MAVGTGNNTCLCSRAAADKTNKCRDWKIQVLTTDHAISDGSLPGWNSISYASSSSCARNASLKTMLFGRRHAVDKPAIAECSIKSYLI
jgi:hypothetical protein